MRSKQPRSERPARLILPPAGLASKWRWRGVYRAASTSPSGRVALPVAPRPRRRAWQGTELPARFWWQGVTQGRLERATHLLITGEGKAKRLLTFGEFEDLYRSVYEGADKDNRGR